MPLIYESPNPGGGASPQIDCLDSALPRIVSGVEEIVETGDRLA